MLEYLKLIYFLLRRNTIFVRWTSHALGDNLLLSLLLPDLRDQYPEFRIIVETKFPELFLNNPYVDWVTDRHFKTTGKFIKPKYRIRKDTTTPIYRQMMSHIGIDGERHPQLFLSEEEINEGRKRFPFRYIAICPRGKMRFTANRKEWGMENFQKLVALFPDSTFIQIGNADTPLLNDVVDGRDLPVRMSAVVIYNSLFFIGLEGGLMHISRAVNKRSVIIYGGFIDPDLSRYDENLNIVNLIDCSPCFTSERKHTYCDSMKCMKQITPEAVSRKIIEHFSEELT